MLRIEKRGIIYLQEPKKFITVFLTLSSSWARTPPFHGGNMGSNPIGVTKIDLN